mmetsp:Transcript_8859/g.29317  ORF Transcript_8859/g.29317 Transcript_8859/m.29317 type:complete len:142 (-) Transcript_8859:312-737(-)
MVEFDPTATSYAEILRVFWKLHNPSRVASEQYKSAIWPQSEEQRRVAMESVAEVEARVQRPIMTSVEEPKEFHKAEWYHQDYKTKNNIRLAAAAAVFLSGAIPPGAVPGLEVIRQVITYGILASLIPQLLPGFDKLLAIFD